MGNADSGLLCHEGGEGDAPFLRGEHEQAAVLDKVVHGAEELLGGVELLE